MPQRSNPFKSHWYNQWLTYVQLFPRCFAKPLTHWNARMLTKSELSVKSQGFLVHARNLEFQRLNAGKP